MKALVIDQSENKSTDALVKLIGAEVLPALKAYYPASDFNWRGNLSLFANEYAKQISGMGIIAKHVRAALEMARLRSTTERHAPNPVEFKIMCLQARGMPTLELCIEEINRQRIENYGKEKTWSEPLVYWLNQQTAMARANLSDSSWQKLLSEKYTLLADKYGKGELQPIPLRIEHNTAPAYTRYL